MFPSFLLDSIGYFCLTSYAFTCLHQACAKRIAVSKEGDCEPWYFDYLKCLDDCVSLFRLVRLFFYYVRKLILCIVVTFISSQRVPQIRKHLK